MTNPDYYNADNDTVANRASQGELHKWGELGDAYALSPALTSITQSLVRLEACADKLDALTQPNTTPEK